MNIKCDRTLFSWTFPSSQYGWIYWNVSTRHNWVIWCNVLYVPSGHFWMMDLFNWKEFLNFATNSYETHTLAYLGQNSKVYSRWYLSWKTWVVNLTSWTSICHFAIWMPQFDCWAVNSNSIPNKLKYIKSIVCFLYA